MVITRYYRSLVASRSLAPPVPLEGAAALRYRAWQRHERRKRALDRLFNALLWLNAERYRRELRDINASANERIADVDDAKGCGYIEDTDKPKGSSDVQARF